MHVDVTSPEEVSAAVAAAVEMGPLRVLVNCAGIASAWRTLNRDGEPHDLDKFQAVVNVNLVGSFNCIRLAAVEMAKTGAYDQAGSRGAIVNTASVAAFDGQVGQVVYSASKGGVVGMTLPVARDLSSVGIRVNTIAPGIMDTPMLAGLPEKARESLGQQVLFPKHPRDSRLHECRDHPDGRRNQDGPEVAAGEFTLAHASVSDGCENSPRRLPPRRASACGQTFGHSA